MELRHLCLRDEDFTDQAPNLTILIEIYFSHTIVFEKCVLYHSVGLFLSLQFPLFFSVP